MSLPPGVNPFEVLGLNKTVLGGLSDDDVQSLAKASYLALSKIYHPDKQGGNSAIFTLVNDAFEQLKDDTVRHECLADHLASRADKLDGALSTIKELKAEAKKSENKLIEFVEDLAFAPYSDALTPFIAKPATLVLVDQHTASLDYYFRQSQGLVPDGITLFTDMEMVNQEEAIHSTFLVEVLPDGGLIRHKLVFVSETPLTDRQADKLSLKYGEWKFAHKATKMFSQANAWYTANITTPDAADDDIVKRQRRGQIKGIPTFNDAKMSSLFCFASAQSTPLKNWRIIGSLPAHLVLKEGDDSQLLKQLGGSVNDNAQLQDETQDGYSLARFRHYLAQLSPVIGEDLYLIGAHKTSQGMRYAFLGRCDLVMGPS